MMHADDTPVMYSPKEVRRIRAMMDMAEGEVLCPRCGEPMHVDNSAVTERGRVFQVRCKPCRCTAVIRDDPGA
jgi:formylmethanofuran dehydrogenase subunit E